MTHILLLSMWATAISAWYTAFYFYRIGMANKQPDMGIVFKCIIASGLSLFIGCVVYSFLQATLVKGVMW